MRFYHLSYDLGWKTLFLQQNSSRSSSNSSSKSASKHDLLLGCGLSRFQLALFGWMVRVAVPTKSKAMTQPWRPHRLGTVSKVTKKCHSSRCGILLLL